MHRSVLLDEAVEELITDVQGLYIDGTFGRGGHSREILARLQGDGRLLAFDKDPDAIAVARQLAEQDKRFHIEHRSFAEMMQVLTADSQFTEQGSQPFCGVLLDLGVSSPQLDQAARGFSFMKEGPLDMRMDNSAGQSVAEWLAEAAEADIARVIKTYGEERFAKRIARAIVSRRETTPLQTTAQLAQLVAAAAPFADKHKHPATRTFQALRIFINNELGDLEKTLQDALALLAPGGRMVVISFHSLEDRITKQFMNKMAKGDAPRGLPLTDAQLNRRLRLLGKARKASAAEIAENPRARSAIMRVAEKIK